MSVESLFIKPNRSIDIYKLDNTHVESHSSELEISTHPVEIGAEITDHAVLKPEMLTVTGEVTDTPLDVSQNQDGQIVFSDNDLFGSSTTDSKTRSQVAHELFKELQRDRVLVSIQTGLELYPECLIKNISISQDSDTSRTAIFTFKFQRVLLVESETLNIDETNLTREQLSASNGAQAQGATTEKSGRKELQLAPASIAKTIERILGGDLIQ